MAIKRGEIGLDVVIYTLLMIAVIITLYPILFVFFMSISTPQSIFKNAVIFIPDRIYINSYMEVLQKPQIWTYYYNTIWVVIIGTPLNLVMTLPTAYVLSRRDFKYRNHVMAFVVFTMFFSGGLIPFYIQVRRLGLMNTRWALVLPFALSAWHVIIARTYFQSTIPESLHEAAVIDGASKFQILLRVIAPLSKPIMAVIALWCAVGFWNSYFWALIFLPDPMKQPIQIFLMRLLVYGHIQVLSEVGELYDMEQELGRAEQMKYVVIVITILPILFIYPFLQKYFIKGIMIGSLKY